MSRDPGLNGMLYFEAVARLGRVSRAAEELEVSPSAVSQQVKLLEQRIGVRLFRRDKRRLSLTSEGARLYQSVSTAFNLLRNARQVVSRQQDFRQLILRVSPSFGVRWLAPRLSGFIEKYPSWGIRVDATPDPSDFEREVIDLDVRYGAGDYPGLFVEPIANDYVLPMCSPAYLESLSQETQTPAELIGSARLVDSVQTLLRWDEWLARNAITADTEHQTLRFDRSSMSLQLAVRDMGVVLESATIAYDELAAGNLVPLSRSFNVVKFPTYWIVSPSRHQSRRIVRYFCDWLKQETAKHENAVESLLAELGCKTVPY